MARGVSAKAEAAERAAFKQLGKQLNGKAIVSPAGFDAGFPDFGYRIQLENGKTVDLMIEYKADYKAQMGSMRDWIFDGRKFVTMDINSESKQELLAVMNNTPKAIQNAKRLLNDLKKYFSPQVKQLYSGSLTVIRNKDERRSKTQEFAKGTENYQIAAISDRILGNKIIDHYKTKFKKNLKSGSDASILFMMLKDKIWMVDKTGTITADELNEVAKRFGIDQFDKLNNLTAKLEVRIQPRGLNSPGKPTSIDVMASFRLAQAPAGGGKVI